MGDCPLSVEALKTIAYGVCYQVRGSKAGDAPQECTAFAELVASNCHTDYDSILADCRQTVLDPWGTDIFLGWLGQLFAPNDLPSPDCPYIANQVAIAIDYAIKKTQEGSNENEAVNEALDNLTPNVPTSNNNDFIEKMQEMMMNMMLIQVMSNMMQNMMKSSSSTNINKVINELVGTIIPLIIIMQLL